MTVKRKKLTKMLTDSETHPEKPFRLSLLISIERVKSISDNIFSFAMTLLIIQIHIPQLPSNVTDIALLTQVASQWPEFLTYIISFLNISNYWMLHNSFFIILKQTDRTLTRLNLLFLLTVTFLPYPTALQGKYGRHAAVALVYGLTIAMNYILLFMVTRYAVSKPELLVPNLRLPVKKVLAFRLLLPLGLAIVGTILALFFVRLSFLFFLLVPLSNAIPLHWITKNKDQPECMNFNQE
jgi:uncharacterized membrane protein